MNSYCQGLMEKSIAEGWVDGNYECNLIGRDSLTSEESVKQIAEMRGLSFSAIKQYYNNDRRLT